MPVNLSLSQLLSFQQCCRRFWLEQYHPELEGDISAMEQHLDAEQAADAAARRIWPGSGHRRINGRLGLRKAIEQTAAELSDGAVIFDATFEFEGVSVQIDVLDWSQQPVRAITATSATQLMPWHIDECAIQAWVMEKLKLPAHRFFVALTDLPNGDDATPAGGFSLVDVTGQIEPATVRKIVEQAREQHASLQEPDATMGSHCRQAYPCPFLTYCENR
jgi:hypothetical protein